MAAAVEGNERGAGNAGSALTAFVERGKPVVAGVDEDGRNREVLKRRLSDIVYRALLADAEPQAVSNPGTRPPLYIEARGRDRGRRVPPVSESPFSSIAAPGIAVVHATLPKNNRA